MSNLLKNSAHNARGILSKSDLSENGTQDNVSMNNFKNNLTAFERQAEGGEMHNGKEGC